MVYSTFSTRPDIYEKFVDRLNEHPKVNAMPHGISSDNWGNPFSGGGFGMQDYWRMIHVTPAKGSDISPNPYELVNIIKEAMGELPEKVSDKKRFGLFPQSIQVRKRSFIEPVYFGFMVNVFIGRQPAL